METGCMMVSLLPVASWEWTGRALLLLSGPGLTKGEFWLLVISGSAGIRALHHEGSVIASSVIRRVCGGLVKGRSVGKTWYKGHRKEGTLVFR